MLLLLANCTYCFECLSQLFQLPLGHHSSLYNHPTYIKSILCRLDITKLLTYVTRFVKGGNWPFCNKWNEFYAPYHRCTHTLSKHNDRMTRDGQVCFSFYSWLWKTTGSQYRWCGISVGLIQVISQVLNLFCVVAWNWCGGLFEYLLLTGHLLLPPTPSPFPTHVDLSPYTGTYYPW